ncbi:MAG TPA: DUF5668 domain-containing protein [Chloroflexota bacterium]|nr:DUF5668 domain-containing protein [Chloroflexota bacterium]
MERSPSADRQKNSQAGAIGGVVLIGLGVLFLLQQALGFDVGHYAWPVFIILPGLAMLGAFVFGPRGAAGLAVPGCVVTTIGLMLAVQNAFGLWETWAYSWTLIVAAVGIGLTLQGERLGQPKVVRSGMYLFEGGLLGFIVFVTFFELILDISHFGLGQLRGLLGPAVLILAGLYLLLRYRTRPASDL